jgi:hypothetical protein
MHTQPAERGKNVNDSRPGTVEIGFASLYLYNTGAVSMRVCTP